MVSSHEVVRGLTAALLAGLAVAAMGCGRHGQEAVGPRPPIVSRRVSAKQLEPFTRDELAQIQGNVMHDRHFAGGAACGDCHLTDETLPIDQAQKACVNCHKQRTVAKPVWQEHCLACHPFTLAGQREAENPQAMMRTLCRQCHKEEDPEGGHLYAFCRGQRDPMIRCDRCHRPHDSAAPAAVEVCVECHSQFKQVQHPQGSNASCSTCHRPHAPRPAGSTICVACHGQAENVLVHNVPQHPKDCLVCHNAHFTTITIRNVCSDCHKGIVYNGSPNQPAKHRDCRNCHSLANFHFRGTSVCASCHRLNASALRDPRTPDKHKNCITCHPPHRWKASFSNNCSRCHKLDSVLEHRLPFHPQDCAKCHDPHRVAGMTRSGDCAQCHSSVPSFGTSPPEMHLDCENCHPNVAQKKFDFPGPDSTCQVCHAQALSEGNVEWSKVPSGHLDCTACHAVHSWKLVPAGDSCAVCHGDVAARAPNEMHADCFNCHGKDHLVKFAGVDSTCKVCHSDLPGEHSQVAHQDCLNCHSQHSFKADTSACTICHGDKAEGHHPEKQCIECHTFRAKPEAPKSNG